MFNTRHARFGAALAVAVVVAATPAAAINYTVGTAGSYATIQGAIDDAVAAAGDHEIQVQTGTYSENLSIPSLGSSASLRISGGWNAAFASRDPNPSLTVVDGGMLDRVLDVTANSGVLEIDGLTFQNGARDDEGAGIKVDPGSGASLQMTLSSCRVRDNVLSNPSSSVFGGGIYGSVRGTGSLTVDGCEIDGNTADAPTTNLSGGGGYVFATQTAAIEFRNNHIHDNSVTCNSSAKGGGLAIRTLASSTAEIVANRIEGNSATSTGSGVDGAGLVLDAFGTSSITAHSLVVVGNTASGSPTLNQVTLDVDDGSTLQLTDTLVADSAVDGVAAYIRGVAQLTNLTVADNDGVGLEVFLSGVGAASVYNTIAYGNGTDVNLPPAVDTGSNLVGVDPLFVDPAMGDYRVMAASDAIDAGDDSPPGGLGLWDAGGPGSPRVLDDGVDIGAYESSTGSTIFADGFETGLDGWSTATGAVAGSPSPRKPFGTRFRGGR